MVRRGTHRSAWHQCCHTGLVLGLLALGLVLPLGELFLHVPLLRLGRALVCSPAPSVFLYSHRLQFDVVITADAPAAVAAEAETVIPGTQGFLQQIRGPFWRKAVYLNAFHLGREDVLKYAFFLGGRLGEDFGIAGEIRQVTIRQWDADIQPVQKAAFTLTRGRNAHIFR